MVRNLNGNIDAIIAQLRVFKRDSMVATIAGDETFLTPGLKVRLNNIAAALSALAR